MLEAGVAAGVAAGVVTFAATPVVLAGMRRLAAIDEVNERSSHQVPTPRGGGVAPVLGIFAGITVLMLIGGTDEVPAAAALSVAVCLLGLVGLAEDLAPIPALRRLTYHAVAGLAVTGVVLTTMWMTGPEPDGRLVLACALLGPLWVTAFVNAFNFMDGVNGISAVQAVVAGIAFALLGSLYGVAGLTAAGAVVAGAAAGFAPFNMPRARIFLGDVGSYALGAALAVLAMIAVLAGIAPEAAIAPLAIYLADTGTTLLRRIRAGETWHKPHRSHVYQQLAAAGWPHTTVSLTTGAHAAVLSALGVAAAGSSAAGRVGTALMALAVIGSYLMLPKWATASRTSDRLRQGAAPAAASTVAVARADADANAGPTSAGRQPRTGPGRHRQPGRHRTTAAAGRVPTQRHVPDAHFGGHVAAHVGDNLGDKVRDNVRDNVIERGGGR